MAGSRRTKNAIHIAKKMARKGYADEGYVDPNDPVNQQYTDPMGGVYGGIQGTTEPNWYDKASDIVAKAGATVGSPVIAGLRGAGESMNKSIYDRPLGYTEKEKADFPRFTQATEEYYKPVQHVGRVLMSPFAGMIGGSGEFVREGAEQLGAEPNLARQLGRETSSMVEWGMTRGDIGGPRAPTDVSSIARRGEVLPPERNAVTRMPEAPRVIDADTPYRIISGEVTPAEMPRDTARVTAEPMRQLEAPQQAEVPQYARDANGNVINRPDINRIFEEDARPIPQERPVEAPVAQEAPRQPEPARAAEPQLTASGEPVFREGLSLPEYNAKYKLKARGGNWLGDFLNAANETEAGKAYKNRQFREKVTNLDQSIYDLKRRIGVEELHPAIAEALGNPETNPHISGLSKWIDTKLKKYIMNDMGTAHDPIFDFAERGQDLHVQQDQIYGGRFRGATAYPGTTELGQWWSSAANSAFEPTRLKIAKDFHFGGDWRDINRDIAPWVQNLNPDTPIYDLYQPNRLNFLGFGHLMDELLNATRPDSDLPQNLRLNPSKLDRVTVPQAVQLVDRINKWRAENAERARLLAEDKQRQAMLKAADNEAVKPIKEYENGYKWVDISEPENPDMTPEQKTDTLRAALKYEGDVMGHCVGGYCRRVQDKNAQIYSLRDSKGEPHVTIEVAPAKPVFTNGELRAFEDQAHGEFANELNLAWDQMNDPEINDMQRQNREYAYDKVQKKIDKRRNELRDEALRVKAETLPARIVQIKGKGNKKPADKYISMVQDFIRSREWSDIGDYANADLYRHSEIQNFLPSFGDVPKEQRIIALDKAREEGNLGKYATRQEWEDALKRYLPEGSWTPRRAGGRTNYEIGDYLHRDYFSLGGFEPDAGYVEPEYKAYTPLFSEDAQPAPQEEQSYPMGRREDPIAPVRQGAEERASYDPLRYVTPRSSEVGRTAMAAIGKSSVMPYEGEGPFAGDLSRNSVLYNANRPALNPAALVVHHTAGRGNPEGVMNALNQQGFGVHYIVDRDGKIYASLPSNVAGIHTGTSAIPGINNATTYGVEVIANDDSDILPSQVEAVRSLYGHLQKGNPQLAIYGHGEIGSHKRADEGKTIVSAIRGGEFVPARQVLAKVPIEKRTLRSYGTGEFNSGGTAKGSESSEKPVAFEGTPWRFIDSASSFDIGPGTEPSSQAMEGMVTGSIGVPVGGGRLSAYGSMNPAIAILPKFPGKNEIMYPTYGVTYKKSFKSGGTITDKALMIVSKQAKSRRGRPK